MAALLVVILLVQEGACQGEAAERVASGTALANAFDLAGAADQYARASRLGCAGAAAGAEYLRGLAAARAAYAAGGSPESLEPVKRAVAALDALDAGLPGPAEVSRFVLMAAAASAQSERDEMALLLEHALRLEAIQLAAGQPGAPAVTAHEAAGDLWLQVHRYEEARRAYDTAAGRVGRTPRVVLGLARTASRLKDEATACREYRALIEGWGTARDEPAEIREARMYIRQPACEAA